MIATQHKQTQFLNHFRRPPSRRQYILAIERKRISSYSLTRPMMSSPASDHETDTHPSSKDGISSSTVDPSAVVEHAPSEDEATPANSVQGINGSRSSSHGSDAVPQSDHVIHLSSIEHCMPRAYIRICLAYSVPNEESLQTALDGLQSFVNRIIEAKPYLAGDVIDVDCPGERHSRAEIRFTTHDYLNYPKVEIQTLNNSDGTEIRYEDLDAAGLPPSRLRPEDVSALPPNADPKEKSPVLRVRANIVKGGLIVSIYLHHCISDGTGFDLITSGDVINDGFNFQQSPESPGENANGLECRLGLFAEWKSKIRENLSFAPPGLLNTRHLKAKRLDQPAPPTNQPGRGCVIMLAGDMIRSLKSEWNASSRLRPTHGHTINSVLMALLWRHMTRARRPSIPPDSTVTTSRLLIPVDIRNRIKEKLPDHYFGAAVDSGKAELDLDSLTDLSAKGLHEISHVIRQAVYEVDDSYVRQMIAFANAADENTDVQDIQASNMDRVTGADMYITSWLRLRSYSHTMGMGLGGPDWVRKPWSRDPGSCIILPQRVQEPHKPDYYEVVVQMTQPDMERLLVDGEFRRFVLRVID